LFLIDISYGMIPAWYFSDFIQILKLREYQMRSINYKNKIIFAAASSLLSITVSGTNAYAGMVQELTKYDINEAKLLKDNNIVIGGWANAGITYNAAAPANNFNGPVTFADRSGEFQLNQLNLFAQRAVAAEGDAWDFGGRVDAMFGTDAIFTQAYGVPAFDVNTGLPLNRGSWDLNLLGVTQPLLRALPQAYAEAYAPSATAEYQGWSLLHADRL
jgi:hypothetical protein